MWNKLISTSGRVSHGLKHFTGPLIYKFNGTDEFLLPLNSPLTHYSITTVSQLIMCALPSTKGCSVGKSEERSLSACHCQWPCATWRPHAPWDAPDLGLSNAHLSSADRRWVLLEPVKSLICVQSILYIYTSTCILVMATPMAPVDAPGLGLSNAHLSSVDRLRGLAWASKKLNMSVVYTSNCILVMAKRDARGLVRTHALLDPAKRSDWVTTLHI
jgi:hypothetical protein